MSKKPTQPNQDDIEDAEVMVAEETPTNETATETKTTQKTGVAEPIRTTGETKTQTKINWGENDFTKTLLAQKPIESSAKPAEETKDIEEPSPEEKRQFLAGEFDEPEQMTLEELMDASELCIDLLDAMNSTAVGAWAGESADKFALPASQRKKLAGSLAKVFFKYQVKMGPMAALIIGLLLYFGLTWKAGYSIKRDKKIEAEKKAAEEMKEKNRKKKEAYRNRIIATMGVVPNTLKGLSDKLGLKPDVLKPELEVMLNLGTIRADHSTVPTKYSITD